MAIEHAACVAEIFAKATAGTGGWLRISRLEAVLKEVTALTNEEIAALLKAVNVDGADFVHYITFCEWLFGGINGVRDFSVFSSLSPLSARPMSHAGTMLSSTGRSSILSSKSPLRAYKEIRMPVVFPGKRANPMQLCIERTDDPAVFVESPRRRKQRLRREQKKSLKQRSRSLRSQGQEATSDPGSSNSSKVSDSSDSDVADALGDGVKRRAAEQLRTLQISQFAARQQLRTDVGGGVFRKRGEVNTIARGFQDLYAGALDVMERNMTMKPPRRAHTLVIGDLPNFG
mmetsp:Transcript_13961/g.38153  ORF Transcript_13961/g.38153 Transcript_13961/m.38153 type:complete len:288 (+) Transcript_13961:71-934(+)|eukprot:CAMPEP_0117515178 /NCGR_PEP_ID=MMETSP0784-20121206/30446_1 /TAXON_ID=39447 /ORGANISM="" /LENGTH=287 /DNA_ID=CAMNT_0005310987 /DNA_START=44 /DNA_END=907 /DNA_ORIENTATION=-